jgi:hypothetical protein
MLGHSSIALTLESTATLCPCSTRRRPQQWTARSGRERDVLRSVLRSAHPVEPKAAGERE